MIRQLQRWIKRYVPEPDSIRTHRSLLFLGRLLHDPYLWRLNPHSLAMAIAVGFFSMLIPIPFQMLLAAVVSIITRAFLPLAIAMVWISNPFTAPFLLLICYKVGAWLLNAPALLTHFEFTWNWFIAHINSIGLPIGLGIAVVATAGAIVLYLVTRLLWSLTSYYYIKTRKRKKLPLTWPYGHPLPQGERYRKNSLLQKSVDTSDPMDHGEGKEKQ